MKWLAERVYNRFDVLWIAWVVLAVHDRQSFAVVVIVIAGALLSAALENFAKRK
jgi:hypothetical protein